MDFSTDPYCTKKMDKRFMTVDHKGQRPRKKLDIVCVDGYEQGRVKETKVLIEERYTPILEPADVFSGYWISELWKCYIAETASDGPPDYVNMTVRGEL